MKFLFCLNILLSLILLSKSLEAQTQYSTSQLLQNSSSTNQSSAAQKALDFMKNEKQTMPVFKKTEFRTETDEFDINRQEYLVRMSFNSSKMRAIQELKTQNQIQMYSTHNQLNRERNLTRRYKQLVNWYFSDALLLYLDEELKILEDKKTIYQKMLRYNEAGFDVEDLFKMEEQLQEVQREILQLNYEKKFALKNLGIQPEQALFTSLDTSQWITIEKMNRILKSIKKDSISNTNLAFLTNSINSEMLDYESEKAKGRQLFDFAQVKYAGRENTSLINEWSFGLGINIPNRASGRVKRNEAMLKMLEKELELEEYLVALKEKIEEKYTRFNYLFEGIRFTQTLIADRQLNSTFEKFQKTGSVSPLSLLRIKESLLSSQAALKKMENEACLIFLEILDLNGILHQSPRINYLSNDLPILK